MTTHTDVDRPPERRVGQFLPSSVRLTDLPDKFQERIMPTLDGCWLWMTGVSSGYGHFEWKGKHNVAHRLVYELLVGSIPRPELHHLCGQKICVNPLHLLPVTHKENMQFRYGTKCNWGHPRLPDERHCMKCQHQRDRAASRAVREVAHNHPDEYHTLYEYHLGLERTK